MSESRSGVFLSYASQDGDAARRIASALRAEGVEVWFDESELRGGEAWDASIQRQIAECALYVATVSAHTQARREGYFNVLDYDYDVAPDGQRFLMLKSEHPETPITQLHAIVSWTEEAKRRVPAPEGQGR